MRGRTIGSAALVAALVLGAGACGDDGDDEVADGGGNEGTTAQTTADTAGSSGTTAPAGGDDCVNDLELSGSEGFDGPIEPGTFWADDGPHPDNSVDYDRQLEMILATYELEVDEQFGRGIPVGEVEVPEGELAIELRFYRDDAQDPIASGQRFVEDEDAAEPDDGELNSFIVWAPGERLLTGDATVTITHLDDEVVCGTIESVDSTTLQTFPTVEGTFVADRIQALDAADEAAES